MTDLLLCLQDSDILSIEASALRQRLDRYWRRAQFNITTKDVYHIVADRLRFAYGDNLPVAALSASAMLSDFSEQDWYAYLDPVHLLPDRDTLLLLPGEQLNISGSEAQQLTKDIAEFFSDEQWRVYCLNASRWLLRLPHRPDLQLTDIKHAQNRDLIDVMPRGADAAQWRKNLNELQMFLHSHPLNLQREREARPTINSAWLWGGAMLSQIKSTMPATTTLVKSDNSAIVGMAKMLSQAKIETAVAFESLLGRCQQMEQCVVTCSLTTLLNVPRSNAEPDVDIERLWQLLQANYLSPLYRAVKQGDINNVVIFFDVGVELQINRQLLSKLWRSL